MEARNSIRLIRAYSVAVEIRSLSLNIRECTRYVSVTFWVP